MSLFFTDMIFSLCIEGRNNVKSNVCVCLSILFKRFIFILHRNVLFKIRCVNYPIMAKRSSEDIVRMLLHLVILQLSSCSTLIFTHVAGPFQFPNVL